MREEVFRVLVVDDDPMQLELVERTLGGDGFQVHTCSSPIGITGVIRSFAPHLVLLDVDIPALSGDRILGIAKKAAPPLTRFIFYSSSDESVLRRLATDAGADGWISKSVTGSDLSSRLRAVLGSSR